MPVDLLNFHVREMREPNYKEITPDKINQTPQPCTDYSRTYLPTGQQVSKKNFEDLTPAYKKLHMEDWRRKPFDYQTVLEGQYYHMVQDKGSTGFRIESNFQEHQAMLDHSARSSAKNYLKNIRNFGAQLPRKDKDYINTLSDSRFEIINKTPEVLSKFPRVPGFTMTGMVKRPEELFGKSETGSFYDAKLGQTKQRLDIGILSFKRMKDRTSSKL